MWADSDTPGSTPLPLFVSCVRYSTSRPQVFFRWKVNFRFGSHPQAITKTKIQRSKILVTMVVVTQGRVSLPRSSSPGGTTFVASNPRSLSQFLAIRKQIGRTVSVCEHPLLANQNTCHHRAVHRSQKCSSMKGQWAITSLIGFSTLICCH